MSAAKPGHLAEGHPILLPKKSHEKLSQVGQKREASKRALDRMKPVDLSHWGKK